MRRCIHCTIEKDETAFNREHVLLEAFGVFEDNLVLHCVCAECNQFYGNDVDRKFARDTMEGFKRYQVGVKPLSDFESYGRKSTTRIEVQDGPLRGALGYHVLSPDGTDLGIRLAPQVGFAKDEEGDFEWFPLDKVPSKEELLAKGYKPGQLRTQTQGEADTEKIRAALAAKGFTFDVLSETPPPSGQLRAEAVFTIAQPEFRAVTKFALNYLAAVTSPDVVLMPAFDEARRFARYGEKPPTRIVHARMNHWRFVGPDDKPLIGHYVSVEQVGDEIVAQVSVLMTVRYTVTLARGGVLLPVPFGHLFDRTAHRVHPMPPLPLEPDARS